MPKDPKIPGLKRRRINPHPNVENLTPFEKGKVSNPYGRRGKSGKGGFSLKTSFKNYLRTLDADSQRAIWVGLHTKAASGDPAAIKLMFELNGEWSNQLDLNVGSGLGCVILPAKEAKLPLEAPDHPAGEIDVG